jgi:DNA/RNA-binding domain of Phe-tRNA-synthetase-like protein
MVFVDAPLSIDVDRHPSLDVRAFVTHFPQPLDELSSSEELIALLALDADAPLHSDDAVRTSIRDMLRAGGFKPTGRSKPAAEYLIKAVRENLLVPINLAVDACNAVSLHSGLPISVVDCDLAAPPWRVAVAPDTAEYVFNAAGHTIDVGGLVCLFDAQGPCANAVKDAQRVKTSATTRRTLSLIWGERTLRDRTLSTKAWYRDLLSRFGAETEDVQICPARA